MDLYVRGFDVIGMPEGSILLFLAVIEVFHKKGFVAVFGPEATCIPKDECESAELFGATVATFDESGTHIKSCPVHHGHKYGHGGGMAETDKFDSTRGVAWQKAGTTEPGKRSQYMGDTILPECILVAL